VPRKQDRCRATMPLLPPVTRMVLLAKLNSRFMLALLLILMSSSRQILRTEIRDDWCRC
jgi:hypothetical protein